MSIAEQYCPYCKRKVIVEHIISGLYPLGIARLHKVEDYKKRYSTSSSKTKVKPIQSGYMKKQSELFNDIHEQIKNRSLKKV